MFRLVSVFLVCSGIGIAVRIAIDLTRHKQPMKIMNAVWILTGLWASYLAWWAYNKFGRSTAPADKEEMKSEGMASMKMDMPMAEPMKMPMGEPMTGMAMGAKRPRWQSIALSSLHCGAGCTLADFIGEWITLYIPVRVGGSLLFGTWVLDFILALILGVYFQFFAIREMERISVPRALSRAIKADFLSLTAWQIGMYGWMAIVSFVLFVHHPIVKDSWEFWFMMQIAMLFGFVCAYPMNAALIAMGVKKGM